MNTSDDHTEIVYSPNSLRYDLAIGSNGWGMRGAALKRVPPQNRCSNFTPHTPDTPDPPPPDWRRVPTFDRALARAHTYGPGLVDVHSSLLAKARGATCLEDLEELEGLARERLSRGVVYESLVARVREYLPSCPGALQALESLGGSATLEEEKQTAELSLPVFLTCPPLLKARPLDADNIATLGLFLYDMLLLSEGIVSDARCAYGKAAETRALREWNSVNAPEDHIVTAPEGDRLLEVPWFGHTRLRGVLDGRVRGNGRVVEIKFRAGAFAPGGMLRDAEHLQVQAYMFMTQTQRAIVLEGVAKRDALILRHREVEFDPLLWQQTTARAEKLLQLQHQLRDIDIFRSAFFGLSTENQVRLVESVLLSDDVDAQENAQKRRRAY